MSSTKEEQKLKKKRLKHGVTDFSPSYFGVDRYISPSYEFIDYATSRFTWQIWPACNDLSTHLQDKTQV